MNEQNAERKVGAFVLVSLLIIAGLIISFGNFEQFFRKTYTLHANFADASGIIKNAQVHYRGSRVGTVMSAPEISHDGSSVQVDLRIRSDVKIDKRSEFRIGSHGMLGDLFIDIVPTKDGVKPGEEIAYLSDGDVVNGTMGTGLEQLLESAKDKLQKFDTMIFDVKSKIITDKFINDFHESVANARQLLERGNRFMATTEQGKGPLYSLLKDQEMAANIKESVANFKSLSYNLKKSGVLFYSDVSEEEKEQKQEEPRKKGR